MNSGNNNGSVTTAFVVLLVALAHFCSAGDQPEPFVVHEWGVNIRSVVTVTRSSHPGFRTAKESEARNILASPQELIDDLPSFVLRHEKEYTSQNVYRSWLKPVLHLYGPDGLQFNIKVLTPQGTLTAYWPKPELIDHTYWNMGGGVTGSVGLKWSGKLLDKPVKPLPEVKDGHWWKSLRDVPSRYVQTDTGTERFLFYEGIAVQDPFIAGRVTEHTLNLQNSHKHADSGQIVVITNDGATRHVAMIPSVSSDSSVKLDKATLEKSSGAEDEVLKICREQWESFGLTAEEAHAVVEAWKPDLLHRIGFIVIACMPSDAYEKMFPLTITPKPDKLVRVGMVFDTLPGEGGRLGWLPALRASVEPWIKDLSNDDFDVRRKAEERFVRQGDIVRPILDELAQSKDAELREHAAAIIKQITTRTLNLPGGSRVLTKAEMDASASESRDSRD